LSKAKTLGPEVFSIASCREKRKVTHTAVPPAVLPITPVPRLWSRKSTTLPHVHAPPPPHLNNDGVLQSTLGPFPLLLQWGKRHHLMKSAGWKSVRKPGSTLPSNSGQVPISDRKELPEMLWLLYSKARNWFPFSKDITNPLPPQASSSIRSETTHLCSKSHHPCLPGWWIPDLCHTWHSGSRTYARTR
jgi:hypothetical protein